MKLRPSLAAPKKLVCDTCGKPATHLTRDVRDTGDNAAWHTWEIHGETRYGCDEHRAAPSRTLICEVQARLAHDKERTRGS